MKKILILSLFLIGCGGYTEIKTVKGEPGQNGKDGESCTVTQLVNGVLIKCGETQAVVLNGENGKDASPTMYSIKEIIDPCGKQASFDEVLLRLQDNTLLAHYSAKGNEFLTVVTPGTYQTTDGTKCVFKVDSNLKVSW